VPKGLPHDDHGLLAHVNHEASRRVGRCVNGMRTTDVTTQLMALCPNCEQWFASAIQMDAETWEGIRMATGLMERCPHCGTATRSEKTEYQFRDQ
jgi:hypothetical protein